MEEKAYEVIECECGHTCPIEFAQFDDGIATCPNCFIEEINVMLNQTLKDLLNRCQNELG